MVISSSQTVTFPEGKSWKIISLNPMNIQWISPWKSHKSPFSTGFPHVYQRVATPLAQTGSPPDALHLFTAGAKLQLHVARAFEEHLLFAEVRCFSAWNTQGEISWENPHQMSWRNGDFSWGKPMGFNHRKIWWFPGWWTHGHSWDVWLEILPRCPGHKLRPVTWGPISQSRRL